MEKKTETTNIIEILSKKLNEKEKQSLMKEDLYGYTPFILAIKLGSSFLVSELIKNGFYTKDLVDTYTLLTPLHHLAGSEDEDLLKLILDTFKDKVNEQDFQGNTALHYAASKRNN